MLAFPDQLSSNMKYEGHSLSLSLSNLEFQPHRTTPGLCGWI